MNLPQFDKMRFLPHIVERIIAEKDPADCTDVICAFAWDHTPQGYEFWEKEYMCGTLSHEGRAALEELLSQFLVELLTQAHAAEQTQESKS